MDSLQLLLVYAHIVRVLENTLDAHTAQSHIICFLLTQAHGHWQTRRRLVFAVIIIQVLTVP